MTQTNPLQADALEPRPFCQQRLVIKGGVNPNGRCETPDCWMAEGRHSIAVDEPRQVARWNTRTPIPLQGGVDVRGSLALELYNESQRFLRLPEVQSLDDLQPHQYRDQLRSIDAILRHPIGARLAALRPAPSADEIIERCAKVADDLCARLCTPAEGPWAMGGQDMCRHIATEIRKLKEQG